MKFYKSLSLVVVALFITTMFMPLIAQASSVNDSDFDIVVVDNYTNSQGAVLEMPNGSILCVFGHEATEFGADGSIAQVWSYDDGETWTSHSIFYNSTNREKYPTGVVVGYRAYVFWTNQTNDTTYHGKIMMTYSDNNGSSWSTPISIYGDSTHRLASAGAIAYKDGHFVIGCEVASDATNAYWGCYAITTTDPLGVWTAGASLWRNTSFGKAYEGLYEPGAIVEQPNGTLMMVMRTQFSHFNIAYTSNYGASWTTPRNSTIFNGDDPFAIKKTSKGEYYLVWCNKTTNANTPRNPLYIAKVDASLSTIYKTSILCFDPHSTYEMGNPTTVILETHDYSLVVGGQNYSDLIDPRRADWNMYRIKLYPELEVTADLYDYNYRMKIPCSHSDDGAQSSYQKLIYIRSGNGVSIGGNVYLNSTALNWPYDIRFATYNGGTVLPYWRESYNASVQKVWVNLNTVNASGDTPFYLYWGYSGAIDYSNGSATFPFFDDFDDFWDKDMWFVQNTDKFQFTDTYLNINTGATSAVQGNLNGRRNFSTGYSLTFKAMFGNTDTQYQNIAWSNATNYNAGTNELHFSTGSLSGGTAQYYRTRSASSWGTVYNIPANTNMVEYTITRSTNNSALFYREDTLMGYTATLVPTAPLHPYIINHVAPELYVDFIYVKKYTRNEPSWASPFGAEYIGENDTWAPTFTSSSSVSWIYEGNSYSYHITINETGYVTGVLIPTWLTLVRNGTTGTWYLNGTSVSDGVYTVSLRTNCTAGGDTVYNYQNFTISVRITQTESARNNTWLFFVITLILIAIGFVLRRTKELW